MRGIFVSLFLFLPAAAAQERHTVRGEIVSEAGADVSWLTVQLESSQGKAADQALVEHDGRFVFCGLEPGTYVLKVLDSKRNEILSQAVTTSELNAPVTVRLGDRPADRPSGQTVSVAGLMHPPDQRAVREAAKAQQFAAAGDHERAAAELEKAVSRDPRYAAGYNNLGVQYVQLGRLADAAGAFRRATAIDPTVAKAQINLAVVLGKIGRLEEAEKWARAAVRLDSTDAMARRVLDSIVAARGAKLGASR
ncbi:MAG TPA: tetratricopeptide repeat protein [Bryobacteraceae bacterium]|nr:tetratricopeptide repeat protein [Bryobacteraceae bacterium]